MTVEVVHRQIETVRQTSKPACAATFILAVEFVADFTFVIQAATVVVSDRVGAVVADANLIVHVDLPCIAVGDVEPFLTVFTLSIVFQFFQAEFTMKMGSVGGVDHFVLHVVRTGPVTFLAYPAIVVVLEDDHQQVSSNDRIQGSCNFL